MWNFPLFVAVDVAEKRANKGSKTASKKPAASKTKSKTDTAGASSTTKVAKKEPSTPSKEVKVKPEPSTNSTSKVQSCDSILILSSARVVRS